MAHTVVSITVALSVLYVVWNVRSYVLKHARSFVDDAAASTPPAQASRPRIMRTHACARRARSAEGRGKDCEASNRAAAASAARAGVHGRDPGAAGEPASHGVGAPRRGARQVPGTRTRAPAHRCAKYRTFKRARSSRRRPSPASRVSAGGARATAFVPSPRGGSRPPTPPIGAFPHGGGPAASPPTREARGRRSTRGRRC